MKISKAVITAAGRHQRTLPLQTLIDRDGVEKSVLTILLEEIVRAGINDICVVVRPGDEGAYADVASDYANTLGARLHFVPQAEPLGYGHAIYCARAFVGQEAFLHLVGDHLYVARGETACAQQLVEVAAKEACTVSAVQATRESLLPYYGTIGGRRLAGSGELYQVERVIEKPTPTQAEQHLIVSGLRAGYYLCFFGMHVLTPTIFEILEAQLAALPAANQGGKPEGLTLAAALAELAGREQYLALEKHDSRYDVGVKYGLLTAQLALALNGSDRDEVLAKLLALLAQRELNTQQA
ncbi:MAG: UTP--glucose-1-phosphate uridylyltransferase [Caldilineaceae bacterium]|nr:UTP--glucose-1-phosphate uridylyltransferase [Caldilineaceae bacterium]